MQSSSSVQIPISIYNISGRFYPVLSCKVQPYGTQRAWAYLEQQRPKAFSRMPKGLTGCLSCCARLANSKHGVTIPGLQVEYLTA